LSRQGNSAPLPLGLLIAAARRSIRQAASARLRRHRLSSPQFWLLVSLHEQPGPSLRELAERRLMDSPTASRVVDKLVGRGFLRIGQDTRDRRRCKVQLTARGAALTRELYPVARQIREAIHKGLTAAETEAMRGMLVRVVANLEHFEPADPAVAARRGRTRRIA
jgi:DNA-binding MarR family transcriptional regulator